MKEVYRRYLKALERARKYDAVGSPLAAEAWKTVRSLRAEWEAQRKGCKDARR